LKVLLNTDGEKKFYGSGEKRLGMLHLLMGDGKGKTSAAVGLCVRARGAGYKALFVQFFKMHTSELEPLRNLGVVVKQFQALGPFFKKYDEESLEELKSRVEEFWEGLREEVKRYDLAVLDESGYLLTEGFLPEQHFLALVKERGEVELVLTGREFPQSLLDLADYASEVRKVKHPFDKGVAARRGVEF